MDTTITEYSYELDSQFRTSGTNEAPSFELPTNMLLSHPDNYFEIQVIAARLPYSFYNVTSDNNTILIQSVITDATPSTINVSQTYTFPVGFYTITTLMAQLKTFINANNVLVSSGGLSPTPTVQVAYSTLTGKVTISITSMGAGYTFDLNIYWLGTTASKVLGAMFGFTANSFVTWYTAVLPAVSSTGGSMVNVSPVTSLDIRCSSLNQISKYHERLESNTWKQSNVLLSVPITVSPLSWILYENSIDVCRLAQLSIYTIDLYVTGESLSAINFNGVPWRVNIVIREMRAEHLVNADNELVRNKKQTPFKSNELMIDSNQSQPKRFRM